MIGTGIIDKLKGGRKQKNPAQSIKTARGFVWKKAGNDLLSPWKDYHRPQVLIVRVRDGNASFHLGKFTGKLPDISVTTWLGYVSRSDSQGDTR